MDNFINSFILVFIFYLCQMIPCGFIHFFNNSHPPRNLNGFLEMTCLPILLFKIKKLNLYK